MNQHVRILILEDIPNDAELMERELHKARITFTSQRVETKEDFSKALLEFEPDIILSDYRLPQFSGLEALQMLKEQGTGVPFVLVTGSLSEEVAVECMKQGATDYILKSSLMRLSAAVESALKRREAEKQKEEALEALRHSQEQLRQAQKLEALGRLAGGIAHDFNNLLTVIGGYADLLLNASALDDDSREKMAEVSEASERAAALVRQLLAFSRKQILQPEVLNPNEVLSSIAKMLRRLIGEHIEIAISLGEDVGKIYADPSQIEQILINLVVNARDAMPNGGKITIVTENVDLDQTYADMHIAIKPGPYVMLAVSDSGVGMNAETREHIFEPFFTTKEVGKGTGLGLSTVYGIVKQSGGYVWVYSEPGQGTTFKVYLPRMDSVRPVVEKPVLPLEPQPGAETILLVEDEEVVRELVREVLDMNGYTVLEARDGPEAIRVADRHDDPIQLMLTDLVMPKMSGRELAEKLLPKRPEMRVLYMSGYTDDTVLHHGIVDPGISFLQKPFRADALARKVREILDQPRPVPSPV